jgi:hypothetical protein
VAQFGPSDGHGTVLWVDYDNAISMHPVITTNPSEHRLQRIKSASPDDHRISFGCINVPARFYQGVVVKAFGEGGIVYILPDTKPVEAVFPAFAAAAQGSATRQLASLPRSRCADPVLAAPDRVPDPEPGQICAVDDGHAAPVEVTP